MNIFSRYRPRYLRSLVYMLQASEYDVREYLRWYHRTSDFSRVEKRKKIDWTPKAKLLYGASWIFVCVWAVALMGYADATYSDVPLVVMAGAVFLTPFYFPYALALMTALANVVQRPLEYRIVQKAEAKLREHAAIKIAIAGSFGKTSMREILKTALAEGKKVAAPQGSYNTPLGIAKFVQSLQGDEEVLVFELGEYYPGDVRKLCALIRPDIGIITGVNEAHLEKFGTLERAAATIFELQDCLGGKPLYVNAENASARAKARADAILFSREGAGLSAYEWRVENPRTSIEGTSFVLIKGATRIAVHSKLLGLHMIGPLAASADIASRLGLSEAEIRAGLSKTKPFPHRLEPRPDSSGVMTLDDSYNGNPDGVAAAIDLLATTPGRRWYVTPGLVEMGSRKREVHEEIGRRLARAGIEKVVLMRNSVTPSIAQGLKDAGYRGDIVWFEDPLAAYAAIPRMTVAGDVVLLQNDWPDQYA